MPVEIYKYKSYGDYIKSQTAASKEKRERVWATEEELSIVCDYMKPLNPKMGICHGVRNGWEVDFLITRMNGVEIIGTDLSHHKKNGPTTLWPLCLCGESELSYS